MTASELKLLFENVDDDKRQLAYDTIDDYCFFMERIAELKKLPYIRVHPKDPNRQQLTPAAKLIKEYSQLIDSKRRTLLMISYRNETSSADELLQKLSEFE